ncbi:MAG: hypothetical protein NWQ38_14970 [Cellulophaga sp.]|nr:hypothetical protein [Cellulophaga sp.]
MKAKKFLIALGFMLGLASFASCTNETASSDEQLYEQQAIDASEIKLQDT